MQPQMASTMRNLYLFCAGGLGSRNFRLPCDPSPESAASTMPCVYQPSGDLGNSARGKNKQCLISPSKCLPNIQHHTDSCRTAGNACIHAYRQSYFCVCIHAHMHACMHACIQPCVCACIHACMQPYALCVHACIQPCVCACIHGYMNACMQPYTCTCESRSMRPFIHPCMHAQPHRVNFLSTSG